MSNVPLMFQPLVKYVDFQGRARRSEFWLWVLFRILVGMAFQVIVMSAVMPMAMQASTHPEMLMARIYAVVPFISIINLALLLPSLAVGVRRLHDINRTGWWLVMPLVVMLAGLIIFFIICGATAVNLIGAHANVDHMSDAEGMKLFFGLFGGLFLCVFLPALIADIVLLVFYITEGSKGANRFGELPKANDPKF